MKTIETINYKKSDHGVYYMELYHPYYSGNNPNFDAFSGRVLDFKNGKKGGLDYFLAMLYAKKIYEGDYTIVSVPPSDPAKHLTHGTKIFVDSFCSNPQIKSIKNGSGCLQRTVKVPKSVSGNRSIKKHLDSIVVSECSLTNERTSCLQANS